MLHCCFDFHEILQKSEQGVPHFHFTLGPANDGAGPHWSKVTMKGVPARRSHSPSFPSFLSPEAKKKKRLGCGKKEEKSITYSEELPGLPSEGTFWDFNSPTHPSLPLSYPFNLNFFKGDGTSFFILNPTRVCYVPARHWARAAGNVASSSESLDSQAWIKGLVDLPHSLKFTYIKLTFYVFIDKHDFYKISFWWRRRGKTGCGIP